MNDQDLDDFLFELKNHTSFLNFYSYYKEKIGQDKNALILRDEVVNTLVRDGYADKAPNNQALIKLNKKGREFQGYAAEKLFIAQEKIRKEQKEKSTITLLDRQNKNEKLKSYKIRIGIVGTISGFFIGIAVNYFTNCKLNDLLIMLLQIILQ